MSDEPSIDPQPGDIGDGMVEIHGATELTGRRGTRHVPGGAGEREPAPAGDAAVPGQPVPDLGGHRSEPLDPAAHLGSGGGATTSDPGRMHPIVPGPPDLATSPSGSAAAGGGGAADGGVTPGADFASGVGAAGGVTPGADLASGVGAAGGVTPGADLATGVGAAGGLTPDADTAAAADAAQRDFLAQAPAPLPPVGGPPASGAVGSGRARGRAAAAAALLGAGASILAAFRRRRSRASAGAADLPASGAAEAPAPTPAPAAPPPEPSGPADVEVSLTAGVTTDQDPTTLSADASRHLEVPERRPSQDAARDQAGPPEGASSVSLTAGVVPPDRPADERR